MHSITSSNSSAWPMNFLDIHDYLIYLCKLWTLIHVGMGDLVRVL